MDRRNFLKNSALASTAFMAPSFLSAFAAERLGQSRAGKVLIVVQLSGGNDGLNTFVPYRNDLYYSNRPQIAVPKNEVLPLSDKLGVNPVMASLRELYDEGLVSVINNVGYPNPDRSHFRSMDIWHTGSGSKEYWQTGWLGRYLDSSCSGCENPHHIIETDDSLSLALKGEKLNGFAMSNPQRLKRAIKNRLLQAVSNEGHDYHEEHPAAYLYKVMVGTQSSADYLSAQVNKGKASSEYPETAFGKDLKMIAELIQGDTDTKVYYVSLSGFDTHANQTGQHERLLKQYADGMKALVDDLKRHYLLKDTLVMTFSEFGRRVKQNAGRGTDHGTANNVVLIGGQLKKAGLYNDIPDLSKLDKGDLIYKVDFRSIYAEILDDWLDTSSKLILKDTFPALGII